MFERSSMISVGERLAQERTRRGLTIDEVARTTKIRPNFLIALEKGQYNNLPSSAYIQGFIRNYAEFLGLPSKKILTLFRREFNEKEYFKVLPESFSRPRTSKLTGFRVRTTTIAFIASLFFICCFVLFQYRAAFTDPSLSIISPKENAAINDQIISVAGKTDSDIALTVNDMPAYVDKNGNFKKEIQVIEGNTAITVKAVNRFKRKSIVIRHIMVTSQ